MKKVCSLSRSVQLEKKKVFSRSLSEQLEKIENFSCIVPAIIRTSFRT